MNENKLVSADYLRKLIGTSSNTIHGWAKEGKFPQPIRLSRKIVRWNLLEVEQWLQKSKSNNVQGEKHE